MTHHIDPEPLDARDPRVRWPLFTLNEAAGYLGLPPSTIYSWARPRTHMAPLITTLSTPGHQPSVPFVGFAEAFVITAAKNAGVPPHRIRPGVEAIKRELPIDYALANRRIWTDGAEILRRLLDEDDLEVARTSQKQFTDTVRSQLKGITYAEDGFASRLQLSHYDAVVTVDPLVASGRPLLASGGGVRVRDLIGRYKGGDSPKAIAQDFDVPLWEVCEVLGLTTAA